MEQANNISDFKKIIKRFDIKNDAIFRGQGAKYEHITSSIARDKGYLENEFALYAESKRLKESEFEKMTTPIQSLAKLQHYGIPTRLIDVTINPLIGLFFAVQNIDNKVDGYVYLYSQRSHDLNSKNVRLLSLLATLEDYNIENIQNQYNHLFNDTVTEEEVFSMAHETTFVEYTEELKDLNPRLYNQEGTFAICGNIVEGASIQRQLQTLDSVEPLVIIRIPYEYKASVKRELDEQHGINEPFIYPELPSVADYIKEKYKYTNITTDGLYTLMERSDVSHAAAQRISLVLVLKESVTIDEIKSLVINVIKKEKLNNDVIWVYVAKNGSDYIMRNWVLTGQWINSNLNQNFQPSPIGEVDSQGYYWRASHDYRVLSDFYEENVFKDDKTLFVKNQGYYKTIRPLFDQLRSLFISEMYDLFRNEVNKNTERIREYYMLFSDLGHSKNKDFDDFLHNYQEFISLFYEILLWINRDDLNSRARNYQISKFLKEAKEKADTIELNGKLWERKINIT